MLETFIACCAVHVLREPPFNPPHIALSLSSDERCTGCVVQLGVFRAAHRVGIIFHAESSSWCPQWVSDRRLRRFRSVARQR